MLIGLGLFYAYLLRNRVYCAFVFIGCLSIHKTYVTVTNSTNNVFFFVSDLIIVDNNNY